MRPSGQHSDGRGGPRAGVAEGAVTGATEGYHLGSLGVQLGKGDTGG